MTNAHAGASRSLSGGVRRAEHHDARQSYQAAPAAKQPPTLMARISSIVVGPRIEKLDRARSPAIGRRCGKATRSRPLLSSGMGRGCYQIFDGYHRFHAHRIEGRKTIAVWFTVS